MGYFSVCRICASAFYQEMDAFCALEPLSSALGFCCALQNARKASLVMRIKIFVYESVWTGVGGHCPNCFCSEIYFGTLQFQSLSTKMKHVSYML